MGKRPGYRREKPLYVLKFADGEFEGLEATAKSMPLGDFFELQRLQAKAGTDPDAAEKVIDKLAEVLVGWNLEDEDGREVPCTKTGLKAQDLPLVAAIINAWMRAVASVPNPSPGTSSDGGTSLEASIPMDGK